MPPASVNVIFAPLFIVGALLFMLSDTLLAINRFVLPLQFWGIGAQFWILASYYAAQILIASNALAAKAPAGAYSENSSPAPLGGVTPM